MSVARFLAVLPALFLVGCSMQPNVVSTSGTKLTGSVHGGVQPIAGATVQLYAVNTASDGGAATALLNPAPTTDANGLFNITNTYNCLPNQLVYVVATGGNPGLAGNTTNSAITLVAALGACGSYSGSSVVKLNELTTVAAAYSLSALQGRHTTLVRAPLTATHLQHPSRLQIVSSILPTVHPRVLTCQQVRVCRWPS